jgi:hypothetical protein
MISHHYPRTSLGKFIKPSESSLKKFIDALKKAGETGLTFTELVKETSLSRDTVNRCRIHYAKQGIIEKHGDHWILKSRALALIDEVAVWLEKFESLGEELFTVMLKRLEEIKSEVRVEECVKLAEKVAAKIEWWKDDYGRLEKVLSVVELLPEKSLKLLTPSLKSIMEDFLRKCPPKYLVQGPRIFSLETLDQPSQIENFLGPRPNKKGDPASHPQVFQKALELMCRVLKGEEKFQALMQLFKEALNARIPTERDVRAQILVHVEDKQRLLETLMEMFHQERDPALKASIKEVLENFHSFT